jgi:hypothetical protein
MRILLPRELGRDCAVAGPKGPRQRGIAPQAQGNFAVEGRAKSEAGRAPRRGATTNRWSYHDTQN